MQALERADIVTAFPIQAATIADALAGKDVLGKARTGSGKTLGFGLPIITRLAEGPRPEPGRPLAIVLVPTRELAMQVNDALEPYAHAMHVSLRLVAGGLSMSKQILALERGVHLVVATPGRLADLARRGNADLSNVGIVVLDEADHMADMGFMDEINEILDRIPAGGQRLLFSATLDGDVDRLVESRMSDPVLHDVTGGEAGPAAISHVVINVAPSVKYQVATRIAAREGRTIVFVRTKLAADRIASQMREAGVLAIALHGDKSQVERNAAITGFRAGSVPVLVATDVAARGIHVDSVDLVLQLDPPADHKDYTHRAGRTARAGASGHVVTLVLPHQRRITDRLFEQAGVEPKFRKIRDDNAESMRAVDDLTGGREPSGVPVDEPRLPRAAYERGGVSDRGGRNRPGRDRPGRDRGARGGGRDRGGSSGGRDWTARGGEPRRDDHRNTAIARQASELSQREQAIVERERQLAEREAALASRASQSREKPQRTAHTSDSRPPRKPRSSASGSGGYDRKPATGNKSGARDYDRKPATGNKSGSGGYDRKPATGNKSGARDYDRKPATGNKSGARDYDRKPATGNTSGGRDYDRKPRDGANGGYDNSSTSGRGTRPQRSGVPARGANDRDGGRPARGSSGTRDRDHDRNREHDGTREPRGSDDRYGKGSPAAGKKKQSGKKSKDGKAGKSSSRSGKPRPKKKR